MSGVNYSEQPVFIISSERSGSNLLRKRLTDSQNCYLGPSAGHLLKHLHYQQPYYGDFSLDRNFKKFISDALDLCLVHFSPWKIDWTPESVLTAYGEQSRNAIYLMHFMMNKYAKEQGFQGYICKDNHLFEMASEIAADIPGAKFIYLYRDPRDFILSQLKRPRAVNSVVMQSKLWAYEQTKAIAISERLRAKGRCFFLSYETLVQEETATLERLLDFLDVDPGGGEKYHDDIREDVHEWSNLAGETLRENSGKFLKELPMKQIALAESICSRQMVFLGYQRISVAGRDRSRALLYLDILLGLAKREITSMLSKTDKESAVYKRRAALSRRERNQNGHSDLGLVSREQREGGHRVHGGDPTRKEG